MKEMINKLAIRTKWISSESTNTQPTCNSNRNSRHSIPANTEWKGEVPDTKEISDTITYQVLTTLCSWRTTLLPRQRRTGKCHNPCKLRMRWASPRPRLLLPWFRIIANTTSHRNRRRMGPVLRLIWLKRQMQRQSNTQQEQVRASTNRDEPMCKNSNSKGSRYLTATLQDRVAAPSLPTSLKGDTEEVCTQHLWWRAWLEARERHKAQESQVRTFLSLPIRTQIAIRWSWWARSNRWHRPMRIGSRVKISRWNCRQFFPAQTKTLSTHQ